MYKLNISRKGLLYAAKLEEGVDMKAGYVEEEKPQPAIRNGWFWWCPIIYYKEKNDQVPFLCAKYWCLGWLFDLTLFIHNSILVISDYLGIDIDKSYPIRLEK